MAVETKKVPLGGESAPFHLEMEILNKKEVIDAHVGIWWYLGAGQVANYKVTEEQFATTVSHKF